MSLPTFPTAPDTRSTVQGPGYLLLAHRSLEHELCRDDRGDTTHYYPLGPAEAKSLAASVKLTLPEPDAVDLGIWAEWGGKLVFGLLLAFALYSRARRANTA
jgi:hypothetical protein